MNYSDYIPSYLFFQLWDLLKKYERNGKKVYVSKRLDISVKEKKDDGSVKLRKYSLETNCIEVGGEFNFRKDKAIYIYVERSTETITYISRPGGKSSGLNEKSFQKIIDDVRNYLKCLEPNKAIA